MEIRICHFINQLTVGGLENITVQLMNYLPEEQFRQKIIVVRDEIDSALVQKLKNPDAVLNLTDIGTSRSQLSRYLKNEKIHIMHSRNPALFFHSFVATLASTSCHLVHSYHGLSYSEQTPSIYLSRLLAPFYSHIKRLTNFFTLTKQMAYEMAKLYNISPKKIHIIPNGVDTRRFYPISKTKQRELKAEFGISSDTIILGYVGRFSKIKNLPALIHFFDFLLRECQIPNIKLLLVGDGPEKKKIENLVNKLNMNKKVVFPGQVSETNVYYQIMDIYLQFSFSEGCSNTLLEAMSTGLPAVVTNVCGNKDIIKHQKNGFLVNIDNQQEVAELVRNLIFDELKREDVGKKARRDIEDKWSIPSMIDKYCEFYKSILINKGC